MSPLVHALAATWPPFVLVLGLLIIGQVAAGEGLFDFLGGRLASMSGGGVMLFVLTMAVVAAVTAVLNLDTSVVFMTPVALRAARSKGADETALLYGTIFMSNSASLLFVGSNLTNLLVFSAHRVSAADFVRHTGLAWLAAVAATNVVVLAWRWRALRRPRGVVSATAVAFRPGPGVAAVVVAVVVMVLVDQPALWVFAAGVLAAANDLLRRHRLVARELVKVTNPVTLASLFVIAVLVGWLARATTVAEHALRHANVAMTILLATATSLALNNLPAASLYGARSVAHPFALLLGLDVGPNCFLTGALSSLLWWRVAKRHGADVSVLRFVVAGTSVALLSFVVGAPLL